MFGSFLNNKFILAKPLSKEDLIKYFSEGKDEKRLVFE